MVFYTIKRYDGSDKKVRTAQSFWREIEMLAVEIVSLPLAERRQLLGNQGEPPVLVGRYVAEMIQPGSVKTCCALIELVPDFFTTYIFSERSGSITAERIFQDTICQEVCSSIIRSWDHIVSRAARQTGRDIVQEFLPPPPPDPRATWTQADWLAAYTTAASPEKQAEVRWDAQARGIALTGWPVEAELRARFREATEKQRYDLRFALRQEARALGISSVQWDQPERPPLDIEQAQRRAFLEELEQSEPLPEAGDYCLILASFAKRAKELRAPNLEHGFRAVATYWFKHSTEDREWFLRDLPGCITAEEQRYQTHLALACLTRVELLRCMQRLLTREPVNPSL